MYLCVVSVNGRWMVHGTKGKRIYPEGTYVGRDRKEGDQGDGTETGDFRFAKYKDETYQCTHTGCQFLSELVCLPSLRPGRYIVTTIYCRAVGESLMSRPVAEAEVMTEKSRIPLVWESDICGLCPGEIPYAFSSPGSSRDLPIFHSRDLPTFQLIS